MALIVVHRGVEFPLPPMHFGDDVPVSDLNYVMNLCGSIYNAPRFPKLCGVSFIGDDEHRVTICQVEF